LLFPLALAAIAALGAVSILLTTHWGAGLTDDSFFYVKPARDVLAGQPFTMDTSWQPLLSFVLIALGWLKIDLLAGVRILNALLFGCSLLLAGLTLKRVTASTAFALLGAGLMLASSDFIDVHSWLMSEALFFFTTLLAIFLLAVYFDTRSLGWLVAAGFAANLAVLTRFIGAAVVIAGVVAILLAPGPGVRACAMRSTSARSPRCPPVCTCCATG
jgi:hypothetical protein